MPVETDFRALTGFAPLSWQKRLYREYLAGGRIPLAVDVPTGLGKTSVMALWLIARAHGAPLPRRLVYVVDRRAVVDQATDEAEKLREALEGEAKHLKERLGLRDRRGLPISTLRGAHVDNREWLDDPAAPAIVVGTVDMIGSRLLFSGYGLSPKMRPYQAGLLGVDALIVLDEAHLVPPFAHLLRSIEQDPSLWPRNAADRQRLPPFSVLPLSATQRDTPEAAPLATREAEIRPQFRLGEEDARSDDIVRERLSARKRLTLHDLDGRKLESALADEAWRLADDGRRPVRCIVFCDSRDVAEKAAKALEQKAAQRKGDPLADVELFVGARRVHERKNAADWLKTYGFIEAKVELKRPAFLIATAAGEVGVDIDADHMVSDLVAWERMVQRLGRVNRRGKGDAQVVVLWSEPSVRNPSAPTGAEQRAHTAFASKAVIERLPQANGAFNASPGALRQLADDLCKNNALGELIRKATTPEPLRPALSRAPVDAWSMTSLKEHTGRPEIAPWLRGWVDPEQQTTVVWRTHLPLRIDENGRTVLPSKAEIEDFFEAARPHESEKLETETHRVVSWLAERAKEVLGRKPPVAQPVDETEDASIEAEATERDADELEIRPTAPKPEGLKRGDIAVLVLSPGGAFERRCTLGELAQERKGREEEEFHQALVGRLIVVDARFGGLSAGLLQPKSGAPADTADASESWSKQAGFRVQQAVSLRDEGRDGWSVEHGFALRRDDEGTVQKWLVVEHFKVGAQSEDARAISKPQELGRHQDSAQDEMERIARCVGLPAEAVAALAVGASLHDEGKRAARWQRAFKAARDAEKHGLSLPLAKTRGPIDQAILGGYRHELGSLLLLEADAEPRNGDADLTGKLDSFRALPEEWRDLVLHLVAAHHGQARPVIETRGCEDAPPSALEERSREIALRFAQLQRRWGPWGLAWWEALMRAADAQASRRNDADENAGAPRGGRGTRATAEG